MKRNLLALCVLTVTCASLCLAGALCAGGSDSVTSAVPEPGSIVLLGTAAIGIGYAALWRSRKK
jgi:hypothetical protein